jgi:hypothetical protein
MSLSGGDPRDRGQLHIPRRSPHGLYAMRRAGPLRGGDWGGKDDSY